MQNSDLLVRLRSIESQPAYEVLTPLQLTDGRTILVNRGYVRPIQGTEAPPVPTTSIYTRGDGVVGWGCSVERKGPLTDSIEVNWSSHKGMGFNPLVWYAVGDRLAQPEDGWSHFRPRGAYQLLYPFEAPGR